MLSLFVLSDPFSLNYNAYCANPLMLYPGSFCHVYHAYPGDFRAYYALSSLASAADPIGETLTSCVGAANRDKAECSRVAGYLGCLNVVACARDTIRIIKS